MTSNKYYTLIQRSTVDGQWYPLVGDDDRSVVVEEMEDYLWHGEKVKDLKIISTGDKKVEIYDRIKGINEGVKRRYVGLTLAGG